MPDPRVGSRKGLSNCKVRQNHKGCGAWDGKDPLASAAGEVASSCVVFPEERLNSDARFGLGSRDWTHIASAMNFPEQLLSEAIVDFKEHGEAVVKSLDVSFCLQCYLT